MPVAPATDKAESSKQKNRIQRRLKRRAMVEAAEARTKKVKDFLTKYCSQSGKSICGSSSLLKVSSCQSQTIRIASTVGFLKFYAVITREHIIRSNTLVIVALALFNMQIILSVWLVCSSIWTSFYRQYWFLFPVPSIISSSLQRWRWIILFKLFKDSPFVGYFILLVFSTECGQKEKKSMNSS